MLDDFGQVALPRLRWDVDVDLLGGRGFPLPYDSLKLLKIEQRLDRELPERLRDRLGVFVVGPEVEGGLDAAANRGAGLFIEISESLVCDREAELVLPGFGDDLVERRALEILKLIDEEVERHALRRMELALPEGRDLELRDEQSAEDGGGRDADVVLRDSSEKDLFLLNHVEEVQG